MSESIIATTRADAPKNSAVNFFHVLVVAPALAYVFYENYFGRAVSKTFSMVALVVVLLMFIFHAYLAYKKTFDNDIVETKFSVTAPDTTLSNGNDESKVTQDKKNQDAKSQNSKSN